MVTSKQMIKDRNGKLLGHIEYHSNGDKVAKNFYGKIIARYYAMSNQTKDFYGKILAQGDITAGLLYR